MATRNIMTAACLAFGAISTNVLADGPVISMLLSANGSATSLSLTGNATGTPNVFNYFGNASAPGTWLAGWNFNASNSSELGDLDRAFTSGNFIVTNTSSSSIVFDFVISMPISFTGPGVYGGSISAGLTTQGAGFFSDAGGAPIWSATTGGATIATMLDAPLTVTRTTTGSSTVGTGSFGQPVPSLPGPDFGTDLTVRLQFTLSAGASASFTSVMVGQVPAPGAAVLLGLGGFLASGRRRR